MNTIHNNNYFITTNQLLLSSPIGLKSLNWFKSSTTTFERSNWKPLIQTFQEELVNVKLIGNADYQDAITIIHFNTAVSYLRTCANHQKNNFHEVLKNVWLNFNSEILYIDNAYYQNVKVFVTILYSDLDWNVPASNKEYAAGRD